MLKKITGCVKRILRNLKPSKIRKFLFITKKMHRHILCVKPTLIKEGFEQLKPYHKLTWKYYGENNVRFTFLGKKNLKTYVIKVAKGFDEKMENSILFQRKFNDVFNFIPHGEEFVLNGYKCYYTELINSVSLSFSLKGANSKTIDFFLEQANYILDELNKFKIVHCDLEEVNILVEKSTSKLYLIDWDTACSSTLGLNCYAFPAYTIKKHVDNKLVFDDAYSFSVLFKRYLDCKSLSDNPLFLRIIEKIGRNEHIMILQ